MRQGVEGGPKVTFVGCPWCQQDPPKTVTAVHKGLWQQQRLLIVVTPWLSVRLLAVKNKSKGPLYDTCINRRGAKEHIHSHRGYVG